MRERKVVSGGGKLLSPNIITGVPRMRQAAMPSSDEIVPQPRKKIAAS
jgi:hypothetical protein